MVATRPPPVRASNSFGVDGDLALPSPVVHTPLGDDASSFSDGHVSVTTPNNSSACNTTVPVGVPHEHRSSLEFQAGPEPFRQAKPYAIHVDPLQDDRATQINLLSFARPHMRAFHYSWLSFFIAFFGWFSIPPLMPTIKKQLQLTSNQVANSNIAAVSSTIAGRVVIGPLCDRYGPRRIQAMLLVVGAVPVVSAALVDNYTGFIVARFFIGLVGCTFVATSYWTSIMFSKEVVGSANALAAGWGNLGAGGAYLITPLIFDLITSDTFNASDDLGWRITLIFPALFMVAVGVLLYKFSDDCPFGNFTDLKPRKSLGRDGNAPGGLDTSMFKPGAADFPAALRAVMKQPVTWILAVQYACSFGVELQVHNVLSLYYYEDFTRPDCVVAVNDANKCRILTQTNASLISSLFGLMCIFARAMGGFASDFANRKYGMRGRIIVQFIAFAGQAVVLYAYSQVRSIEASIPLLILFGVFVQACTGTTFAIVPYVSPRFTGATSGIVGAGGNVGALCWGFLFKGVGDRAQSFEYLSIVVAVSALMCAVTTVEDEGSMWRLAPGRMRPTVAHAYRYSSTQRLIADGQEPCVDSKSP